MPLLPRPLRRTRAEAKRAGGLRAPTRGTNAWRPSRSCSTSRPPDSGGLELFEEGLDDPLRRAAVAVRLHRARHPRVLGGIIEEPRDLAHDAMLIRADDPGRSCLDAFGALRHVSEHEHGRTES